MTRIHPDAVRNNNILIIDIERLPGLAEVWDQKTRYIPVTKWHRLPQTICFSARTYGARGVEFVSVWDQGPAEMARRSWQLYNDADIVVTYNGVRFDNKHLRTDWEAYGLGDPAPWKDVDLFQENLKFGRASYSLQHLAEQLGFKGKSGHYDSKMAELAVAGDERAGRGLARYNNGDTRLTEQVYDACRGQLPRHPHLKLGRELLPGEMSCNQCGSLDLEEEGEYVAQVLVYPQFRCRRCGGWIKDRKSIGRIAWSAGVR